MYCSDPGTLLTYRYFVPLIQGGCIWSCKNGRQLTLSPISLLTLTEVERVNLQKIAQAKLQAMNLGCPVPVPKGWLDINSARVQNLSLI